VVPVIRCECNEPRSNGSSESRSHLIGRFAHIGDSDRNVAAPWLAGACISTISGGRSSEFERKSSREGACNLRGGVVFLEFVAEFFAGGDGFCEEVYDGGAGFGADVDLVAEEAAEDGDADEGLVYEHDDAAEDAVAEDFGVGGGDAADFFDLVAGLFEEFAEAAEGEEAGVGAVEDAFAAVVELADEEHEAGDEEGDVGGGEDDFGAFVAGFFAEHFHEDFGVFEVLDNVEEEDLVVVGDVGGAGLAVDVPLFVVHVGEVAGVFGVLIEAGDVGGFFGHEFGDVSAAAADVEDACAFLDGAEGEGVAGAEAEFEVVGFFDCADVKLAVVEEVFAVHSGADHGFEAVPCVFEAVDVADFVAVVGGDGDFGDAEAGEVELDDDVGVEVEVVGVALEGDAFEGWDGVEAVAAVEFAQLGAEHDVLVAGEDLVADPFVEGHAAGEGVLFAEHAGAEDGVGFSFDEWGDECGEFFGGVLSVAVDEGDDVEAVVDGVAVAEFLVAAVALVDGVAEGGDAEVPSIDFGLYALGEGLVFG
jgi:hypothetical protein